MKWNYVKRELICSMDGYIETALRELEHVLPKQHFYGPSKHTEIRYGERVQYAPVDTAPALTPEQIKYVQRVTGKLLFYAQAIDNTILHTLNEIATQQVNPTVEVKQKNQQLLVYANTFPNIFFVSIPVICNSI